MTLTTPAIEPRGKSNFRLSRVSVRLLLVTGVIVLVTGICSIILLDWQLKSYARREAREKAQLILDRNIAIHHYLSQRFTFGSASEPKTDSVANFVRAVWMFPVEAVNTIDGYSRKLSASSYYYKESAINARNRASEADRFEKAFLKDTNVFPDLEQRTTIRYIDNKPFLEVLHRGETMENACLHCHGIPATAPAALLERYGLRRGFHRRVGQVVSVLSVRVPLDVAYAGINRIIFYFSLVFGAILCTVFGLVSYLGRQWVFAPLADIRAKAMEICRDPRRIGEQIALPSGFELAEMAESFNAMSLALRAERDKLEDRVRERTGDLRQTRDTLKAVLDAAPVGVVIADRDGPVLLTNAFTRAIWGSLEEVAEQRPEGQPDVFQSREFPIPLGDLAEALNGRQVSDIEIATPRADGTQAIILAGATPVRTDEGEVWGAVAVFQDITARKRIEAELQRSEEHLKKAQEIAHLGSWELDLATNRLTWSDEVYRIFGLKPQQHSASYEAFLSRVHPDDRRLVDEAYAASLRENRDAFEIEHRVLGSDGEIRYVHEKCEHRRDTSGTIVGSAGMVHDITERRCAEEAQRWLTNFPEENPNPVLRCSGEGQLLYANLPARRWLTNLGWSEDGSLPPVVSEAVAGICNQSQTIEREITGPDGRTFGLVITRPEGESYVNLYGIELTKRKKAEESLRRSNAELEQFAYAASHDLQEPLRAIVGFLQLLDERYSERLDEKGRHFIERSVNAGYRLQTLIRDLLTLSRVNTREVVPVPTDTGKVVETVRESLHRLIEEEKARIVTSSLPVLNADRSLLRSLFQNLVVNGLRYNTNPQPLIEIDCQASDDAYRFCVRDNGIGIAPQYHERIFMVFQRLHTGREYSGTGLGLALCKKIVERHGGAIWVESQPGEGAAFYFTLPRVLP